MKFTTLAWGLLALSAIIIGSVLVQAESAYLYIPGKEIPTKEGNIDCVNVSDIPQSECQALLDLYNNNGSNRFNNSNRLIDNQACTRYWVTCIANPSAGNNVQYLSLQFNNLHWTLSNNLNNLTQLERLELHGNTLGGSIPNSIGSAQQTEHSQSRKQSIGLNYPKWAW